MIGWYSESDCTGLVDWNKEYFLTIVFFLAFFLACESLGFVLLCGFKFEILFARWFCVVSLLALFALSLADDFVDL